jgi:predicted small lipoprotein YifL
MKIILGVLMAAWLLPLAACGKKSDVIPPPGYQQPASQTTTPASEVK